MIRMNEGKRAGDVVADGTDDAGVDPKHWNSH